MSVVGWEEVHASLKRLARDRAAHDYEEAKWLVLGQQTRVYEHLGFGSFVEYVGAVLGYDARRAHERIRVAEALASLPEIANALRDGLLSWSAVRELVRVAQANTESAWLEAAIGRSVREIEALVAGRSKGDLPTDPAKPMLRRHVLRFEVSGETLALVREMEAKLQRDFGRHVEDDELLQHVARLVLGGPGEEGRAPYQVAVTVCERCGQGWQNGRGEAVAIAPEATAAIQCDAQEVVTHVGPVRATQTVTPATRRFVLWRDAFRCAVPGCGNRTFLEVHHIVPRSEGGADVAENLVTLCSAHHRAQHAGTLRITRGEGQELTFAHADGSPYGQLQSVAEATARAGAFLELKAMGFKEGDARRVIDAAATHVGSGASVDVLVKKALAIAAQRGSDLRNVQSASHGPGMGSD